MIGSPAGVGAADGRGVEPNDPPNGRDYWMAGDDVKVDVTCLDDEHYTEQPTLPMSGTSGPDGMEGTIALWGQPDTYTDIYRCVDDDNEVQEEFSVTYEVQLPFDLVATVGTEAGECADTDDIEVEAGTEVFWCYRLEPDPLRSADELLAYDEVEHVVSDTPNGALGDVQLDPPDHGLPDEGLNSVGFGFESSSIADQPMESTGTWGITVGYNRYDHDTDEDFWEVEEVAELSADARVRIVEPGDDAPGDPAPPAAPVSRAPSYTG